jgi:Ca2+-binding RTX toxin-like protein
MTTTSRIPTTIRRGLAVAALTATGALAMPALANASFGSAISGTTVTLTGDGASDALTFADAGGLLTHNLTGNGFNSTSDFDNVAAGDQTVPANDTIAVVVNAGAGDDTVTLATALTGSATIDGEAGDDLITGNNDVDALRGGDGNDRVVGARGNDDVEGGNGNDTLVWNNGDGSDVMDGDAGNDEVEVNGAPTQGDNFTINPNGARVRFDRVNLGLFNLDIATERLTVNGLGGGDQMTGAAGLAPLIALTLNGGTGTDTITGGDGADLVNGGEDVDTIAGAAGDDRLIADRGNDVIGGGAGDDTLVWNNGDGSDVMDGGDGLDRVEVNGAGAGDAFTIAPNGARARFDRTNLVPFSLDIGTSELLDARGQGGDDTFSAAAGTEALLALLVDGGAGNDALTGSAGGDTLLGGSGNDSLTGGGGIDLLDGQAGDDSLLARDGGGDAARCGSGADSVQTDAAGVDAIEGCETVDATAVVTPPPPPPGPVADTKATAVAVVTRRTTLRSSRGRLSARITVSCPAAELGGCRGTLALLSARKVSIGGVQARLVLGSATYSLRAGQRRTLSVRLAQGARRVARRGAIAATAQTVTRDAARNVATGSRAISLRLPR